MKRVSNIYILILIYFICSARGCMEDPDTIAQREKEYISNLKDSIKQVFTADSIPDFHLKAFEITAVEKLCNFADYLKIISDTTLNLKFRQQATELVRDLFVSDDIELNAWSSVYPVNGLNNLELLISYCLTQGMSCWIQPAEINVYSPLIRANDSTFAGTLTCHQNCISFNTPDTFKNTSRMLFVDIYIIKKPKSFGTEQIRVWEVYLGNIE